MNILTLLADPTALILSFVGLFFIPGYALISLFLLGRKALQPLETVLLSFLAGICFLDFFLIIANRSGLSIDRPLLLTFVAIGFLAASFAYFKKHSKQEEDTGETTAKRIFDFTPRQTGLAVLLIILTVFVKTSYLSETILPTSTDLGHHMYWAQHVANTNDLPVYEEREIVEQADSYALSDPKPIADFIIGEHLPFTAIGILTGLPFLSSFPAIFLLLINVLTAMAMFLLPLRFLQGLSHEKKIRDYALATLLLAGPLYAIASPQAKYISGGVIGNTFGNLFIPIILLCFFRALREKDPRFASLGILLSAGLFYTHHLSGFILLFILVFMLIFFVASNIGKLRDAAIAWFGLAKSPQVLATLIALGSIVAFVYAPEYLSPSAVDTAVGGPSKSTRAGIQLIELLRSSGEARFFFGFLGFALILLLRAPIGRWEIPRRIRESVFPLAAKLDPYAFALLSGWLISIFLMSWKPQWLYLDLPSGRVANYLSFPLIALSGIGLIATFDILLRDRSGRGLRVFTAISILAFVLLSGLGENASFVKERSNANDAVQTFAASEYLSRFATSQQNIVKDHNYLIADSWIKLFFDRGYDYPFSRAYFKRYEDTVKEREQCTLSMISEPRSPQGKKCFESLDVRYVLANAQVDSAQFEKNEDFWKIYENNHAVIFYRK